MIAVRGCLGWGVFRGSVLHGASLHEALRLRARTDACPFTLFLFALLGISALVIDVGYWYQQKRSLQSAADAGALAGAVSLPAGWSSATSTAAGEFGKNSALGSGGYQQASTFVSGDSLLVTASQRQGGRLLVVGGHRGHAGRQGGRRRLRRRRPTDASAAGPLQGAYHAQLTG